MDKVFVTYYMNALEWKRENLITIPTEDGPVELFRFKESRVILSLSDRMQKNLMKMLGK